MTENDGYEVIKISFQKSLQDQQVGIEIQIYLGCYSDWDHIASSVLMTSFTVGQGDTHQEPQMEDPPSLPEGGH